jgi:hypothetical protein
MTPLQLTTPRGTPTIRYSEALCLADQYRLMCRVPQWTVGLCTRCKFNAWAVLPKTTAWQFECLTLFSTKIFKIALKHSVLASIRTQLISISKISWLTLFREIVAIYSGNHTKPKNTLCAQNAGLVNVKAIGT